MNDGALIDGVIRINHLRGGKTEEGIDRYEDNANRVTMNGTSPLKVMIGANEEGRTNIPFPKRREGAVVGLVD